MLKAHSAPPSLAKVDMFALGATLYELASGAPLPSSGDRWSALREGKVTMLPAVTQQLQNLIKVGSSGVCRGGTSGSAGWPARCACLILISPPPPSSGAQKLMSPDPALRPDAASVLKQCDRQMGPLPLRPSNPSLGNVPRTQ